MYIAGKHKMLQMIHNKKSLESIFVDYQYANGKCDVQQMVYEDGFNYGYFHGPGGAIHAPLMENILNLKETKVAKLGKIRKFYLILLLINFFLYFQFSAQYRGFQNVDAYEACVDLKPMLIRVLSTFLPRIPDAIWNVAPTLPAKATFYWADPTWEMEDGTSEQSGPVPLGIDLTITYTLQLGNQFVAIAGNSSMNIANYHSHYPEHDNLQDLLQSPPGIHCKRNKTDDWPRYPSWPKKFHVKTESVVMDNHSFVFHSSDYYDYENDLFRFDLSVKRPGKNGVEDLQVYHDYKNNMVYEINRNEHSCSKRNLDMNPTPGDFESNPITHLLMRPYDLLGITDLDVSFVGKKYCRGMSCHFWTARKDLSIMVGDKYTYGIYSIWGTDGKWTGNFSTSDPDMKHFIVEVDVAIHDNETVSFNVFFLKILKFEISPKISTGSTFGS